MTKHSGGATVNQGGAPEPDKERDGEFDIAGNAAKKGEKPSPARRDRGEATAGDAAAPIDLDSAHERAS
jgi:hypothetical protein